MTYTKKDFVKHISRSYQLDERLVDFCVSQYDSWIAGLMMNGDEVQMPFGKFSVVENKYKAEGIKANGKGFHKHAYRPKFTPSQKFKEQIDRCEKNIRERRKEMEA